VIAAAALQHRLPAVILRPGFVYGPRDRHFLPSLLRSLRLNQFVYVGHGDQKLNHTYAGNLVDAVFLALSSEAAVGETFNVTDDPVASRRQFVETVARHARLEPPSRHVPAWIVKPLAYGMDRGARLLRFREPPLLSAARYKFLALNLEYSIDKIKRVLGYEPRFSLDAGMRAAIDWFRAEGCA